VRLKLQVQLELKDWHCTASANPIISWRAPASTSGCFVNKWALWSVPVLLLLLVVVVYYDRFELMATWTWSSNTPVLLVVVLIVALEMWQYRTWRLQICWRMISLHLDTVAHIDMKTAVLRPLVLAVFNLNLLALQFEVFPTRCHLWTFQRWNFL
jgi:hypothetical protein